MDLIVGAGISGLSYAGFLQGNEYKIIEADNEIGGYCKTIKQDGFTWDYSGHFFHFQNAEIEKYILEGIETESVLKIQKQSQVLYNGRYIDFPFQKNIHQLPQDEFIDCLVDLFRVNKNSYTNFNEMLYAKFGRSIAEKFLIPYNEKLYACDLNKLDAEAMGRFFPYANKEEIILNFKLPNNTSYNSIFTYPEGGAIEYVYSLSKRLEQNNILLNEQLVGISLQNKIAYTTNKIIAFDTLVSSIPFPKLLELCGISFDRETFSWNKVLVFNLGFDKKGKDVRNHWVYFPAKDLCFYRVGYYDNIFSDNRMSLYVELGFPNDVIIDTEYYQSQVLKDLEKAGIIDDHQLISSHSVIMNPAYVHISQQSIEAVAYYKKELQRYNIFSIGRYGSWTYCSIEDNILEAKALLYKQHQ